MGEDSDLSVYRSVDGAHTHLVDLRDPLVGHRSGCVQSLDLHDLIIRQCFGSAANVPSGFGRLQSCFGSLDDSLSLVLGERAGKIQEHTSLCGGAVQLLGQASESHSLFGELVDESYEMFEAAAQSVQSPDNDGVAWAQGFEHPVEFGTACLSATGMIHVDPFASGLLQRVGLEVGLLVDGADPRVSDVHGFNDVITVDDPTFLTRWF